MAKVDESIGFGNFLILVAFVVRSVELEKTSCVYIGPLAPSNEYNGTGCC